MSLDKKLDTVFHQFIKHDVSTDLLLEIRQQLSASDVAALVASVELLGDPSEYCEDDFDQQTPAGFFLYLDFVSALIIDLGEPAIAEIGKYVDSSHHFVKWVVRYVQDDRFHDEILAKFSDVVGL